MVLEVKAALNLEVVLNLPACGKPVGRPLPVLGQSYPLHIVGPAASWESGRGQFISNQQVEAAITRGSNYLPRLFVLRWRPPRVAALGLALRWQLPIFSLN